MTLVTRVCLDLGMTSEWSDAFRAGGFTAQTATRDIGRLKLKIAEGLAAGE
jgi:hypothetical protein